MWCIFNLNKKLFSFLYLKPDLNEGCFLILQTVKVILKQWYQNHFK